jgi:hypothetical protein
MDQVVGFRFLSKLGEGDYRETFQIALDLQHRKSMPLVLKISKGIEEKYHLHQGVGMLTRRVTAMGAEGLGCFMLRNGDSIFLREHKDGITFDQFAEQNPMNAQSVVVGQALRRLYRVWELTGSTIIDPHRKNFLVYAEKGSLVPQVSLVDLGNMLVKQGLAAKFSDHGAITFHDGERNRTTNIFQAVPFHQVVTHFVESFYDFNNPFSTEERIFVPHYSVICQTILKHFTPQRALRCLNELKSLGFRYRKEFAYAIEEIERDMAQQTRVAHPAISNPGVASSIEQGEWEQFCTESSAIRTVIFRRDPRLDLDKLVTLRIKDSSEVFEGFASKLITLEFDEETIKCRADIAEVGSSAALGMAVDLRVSRIVASHRIRYGLWKQGQDKVVLLSEASSAEKLSKVIGKVHESKIAQLLVRAVRSHLHLWERTGSALRSPRLEQCGYVWSEEEQDYFSELQNLGEIEVFPDITPSIHPTGRISFLDSNRKKIVDIFQKKSLSEVVEKLFDSISIAVREGRITLPKECFVADVITEAAKQQLDYGAAQKVAQVIGTGGS